MSERGLAGLGRLLAALSALPGRPGWLHSTSVRLPTFVSVPGETASRVSAPLRLWPRLHPSGVASPLHFGTDFSTYIMQGSHLDHFPQLTQIIHTQRTK